MTSRLLLAKRAVKISLDEAFFTEAWLEEFASYMYFLDGVEDVYADLARLFIDGVIHETTTFIEGYGETKAFNLKITIDDEVRSYAEIRDITDNPYV